MGMRRQVIGGYMSKFKHLLTGNAGYISRFKHLLTEIAVTDKALAGPKRVLAASIRVISVSVTMFASILLGASGDVSMALAFLGLTLILFVLPNN